MIKRAIEDRCIKLANSIVRLELDVEKVRKDVIDTLNNYKKDKQLKDKHYLLEKDYQHIYLNKKEVLLRKYEELNNLKSLLVLMEEQNEN